MLQNRVNPMGELFRTEARGTMMGNRGVIHDVNQDIVRAFKHKAWITCALQFKGRSRKVMSPNRWTELFFLDEATAFAAGHRPCCECRKENFNRFKLCWLKGNPQYGFQSKVSIKEIDTIIHEERIGKDCAKITYEDLVQGLPDGTFVLLDGDPFLLVKNFIYLWSPSGYAAGIPAPGTGVMKILTPRSIVNAFRAGYNPTVRFGVVFDVHS
jgi:hypothetical protein